MTNRTICCIPFCRRTTAEIYSEWICGRHWSMTSKRLRAVYHKRKRRYRKGDNGQGHKLSRIWEKLKHQAMEGEMF